MIVHKSWMFTNRFRRREGHWQGNQEPAQHLGAIWVLRRQPGRSWRRWQRKRSPYIEQRVRPSPWLELSPWPLHGSQAQILSDAGGHFPQLLLFQSILWGQKSTMTEFCPLTSRIKSWWYRHWVCDPSFHTCQATQLACLAKRSEACALGCWPFNLLNHWHQELTVPFPSDDMWTAHFTWM